MRYQDIALKTLCPALPETVNEARVQFYLHEHIQELDAAPRMRPVLVICPGGGYHYTSEREAEPVALPFFTADYQVFVLRYSCQPDRYPNQLLQTAGLIAHIRAHAQQYGIDTAKIAICGFSAGGHLAASAGTLWKEPVVAETLGVDAMQCRPDAMILSYPVITGLTHAHRGSFNALIGEGAGEDALRALSLETRVCSDTPPAFLWHTADDASVPVENTLGMAMALRGAGVSFELHVYPSGPHGIAMADRTTASGRPALVSPHVATWVRLCMEWLDQVF